ncbi:hypothetical protein FRC12_024108 [Ceratobasidium sp. 428]|nr:hypothetical protein FRC12_024108 [Ceratobasidium sp. 428]
MGFITQTFGNSFWSSSTGQTEIQRAPSSVRKYRPKQKVFKNAARISHSVPPPTENIPPSQSSSVRKKRRHASPEATFRAPCADIVGDSGRPSISSSVASDEPLILPSLKGKGKPTGSSSTSQPNPNQSAYASGAWANIPQSPPRLQARPPTTNCLDTYERSQLVRRSRKLGAILGETPRLLDVSESDKGAEEALAQLEGYVITTIESSCQRPISRRSLTLGALPTASTLSPSTPVSASRHSFLLNDENASNTPNERSSPHASGSGPRFGRSRSTARCPPVLRLSLTPTRENVHPYFARRHSSDLSVRRGSSLNNVDMNVGLPNGSDVSIPKARSLDTNSICSSTMPTFARPRSPSSLLDSGSISSRISLHESIGVASVGVLSRSEAIDYSLPPTPTTPLTPVLTQAEDARRKMRKLARHLGESVPADLVLGNAGGRRAPHDHLMEAAAPQFLQVPPTGPSINKTKNNIRHTMSFSLGRPPARHRKTQSVWKGSASSEIPPLPHRLVRRASSAEQLRIDSKPATQMSSQEKARSVHRAMKMMQLFGAPPPHELYTNPKACSLDLPPGSMQTVITSPPADCRASINSFRDLAYILDHDNRNSLLALIGDDMSDTQDDPALSPFADSFANRPTSLATDNEESFTARRARANKLAKFFGVSYRDLFDAVCGDDAPQLDENQAGPSIDIAPRFAQEPQQPLPVSGSEVMTNNGVKWVEPKSVDEVLDRLRSMKTSR